MTPTPTERRAVQLAGVSHRYGATTAVDKISLIVEEGEVLALVGPSGCGKSTLLRVIAGLITPSAGTVSLGGKDATHLRAERRGIGYVPQSYALFPHQSVRENIGYGLAAQKVPRTQRRGRIEEVLELTRMLPFADRFPAQLSGGQRQRVALARALAIRPTVLLLDEPLSALDPQLRDGMRRDLRSLLAEADCTTIIVTHDQSEALALADRVAVMRGGRVVQTDTVERIWDHPAEPFVAEFVAGAATLPARISETGVHLADDWIVPRTAFRPSNIVTGEEAFIVLRPTNGAFVAPNSEGEPNLAQRPCAVVDAEQQGGFWALRVRVLTDGVPDSRWSEITVTSDRAWLPGQELLFGLRTEGATVHRGSREAPDGAPPQFPSIQKEFKV